MLAAVVLCNQELQRFSTVRVHASQTPASVDPAPKDKSPLCSLKEDCVPWATAGAGHHGVSLIHTY